MDQAGHQRQLIEENISEARIALDDATNGGVEAKDELPTLLISIAHSLLALAMQGQRAG